MRVYTIVGSHDVPGQTLYVEYCAEENFWADFEETQAKYKKQGEGPLFALLPKPISEPLQPSREEIQAAQDILTDVEEEWPPKL